MDALPGIIGIVLVAAAAAYALIPFARRGDPSSTGAFDAGPPARFKLYRQVLELEFDQQVGNLAPEDFERLSAELLVQASESLRVEHGTLGVVDEEIEREIAAARAAFAAARTSTRRQPAETLAQS